jgi:hypothetical protein
MYGGRLELSNVRREVRVDQCTEGGVSCPMSEGGVSMLNYECEGNETKNDGTSECV